MSESLPPGEDEPEVELTLPDVLAHTPITITYRPDPNGGRRTTPRSHPAGEPSDERWWPRPGFLQTALLAAAATVFGLGFAIGISRPTATADSDTTTPSADDGIEIATFDVRLLEPEFRCNGQRRVFARLSGAQPGEEIQLISPEITAPLRPGTATPEGNLDLTWFCEPKRQRTSWTITAIGERSSNLAQITLIGFSECTDFGEDAC